ncbi:MAG: ATP-binding protein [Chloroflexi bacterium]|nr:ATP-binding protein [Chloroflexota bacterium]
MEYNPLAADVERLAESLGQFPEPVVNPALIAVSGLPGSGKSYFCSKLTERLPFVILESDTLRKVLFPSPSYDLKENSYLFRVIDHLIEKLLKKGIPLILDATNLSERHREYLYNIADRLNVKLVLVRVEAPPQVVHGRLERRLENPESKSDADWTVYQRMKSSVEKIRRKHYVVDTSRDINPVLDKIVKEVAH